LQPLEKCCNALSINTLTLTFVRQIDLVAPLNINGSFYNTTIIKQNNMAYQHKLIFCIRDGFGVGTYILGKLMFTHVIGLKNTSKIPKYPICS